jgi:hypothetical protein
MEKGGCDVKEFERVPEVVSSLKGKEGGGARLGHPRVIWETRRRPDIICVIVAPDIGVHVI